MHTTTKYTALWTWIYTGGEDILRQLGRVFRSQSSSTTSKTVVSLVHEVVGGENGEFGHICIFFDVAWEDSTYMIVGFF